MDMDKVPSLNSHGLRTGRGHEKILVVNSETGSSYPHNLSDEHNAELHGVGNRPIKLGGYAATIEDNKSNPGNPLFNAIDKFKAMNNTAKLVNRFSRGKSVTPAVRAVRHN
jgi:hypothetical protein